METNRTYLSGHISRATGRRLREIHAVLRRAGVRDVSGELTEALYQSVLMHATTTISDEPRPSPPPRRILLSSPGRTRWWNSGAAVAVVVAATVLVVIAGWRLSWNDPVTILNTERYQTAIGQQATVTLADGSIVTLAPGTTIDVVIPSGQSHGERVVELQGEAIFDVVNAQSAPFVVKSGQSVVRVLGTRFGVRKYANDSVARVAVQSGRVTLNTILLNPGDIGNARGASVPTIMRSADPEDVLSWERGHLTFRSETIATVASQLERWYGLHFVITTPELAQRKVTLTVTEAPVSAQYLKLLSEVFQAGVIRSGMTLTLTPLTE